MAVVERGRKPKRCAPTLTGRNHTRWEQELQASTRELTARKEGDKKNKRGRIHNPSLTTNLCHEKNLFPQFVTQIPRIPTSQNSIFYCLYFWLLFSYIQSEGVPGHSQPMGRAKGTMGKGKGNVLNDILATGKGKKIELFRIAISPALFSYSNSCSIYMFDFVSLTTLRVRVRGSLVVSYLSDRCFV